MTNPTNPRTIALQILLKLFQENQSFSKTIPEYTRDAEQKDFIQELVYGVVRHYYTLESIAQQLLKTKPKDDIYLIILIGLYSLMHLRKPDYASVSGTVDVADIIHQPKMKPLINAVLRNFLRQKDQLIHKAKENDSARYSYPPWFVGKIQKAWPQDWKTILTTQNQHPPLILRINLQKITREDFQKKLQDQKIESVIHPQIPSCLMLKTPAPVYDLPGFKEGEFSVQDAGAQWVPFLLDLKPNESVLDACTAPGGKLTHLLEGQPGLRITAVDNDPKRLEKVKDNLKRLNQSAILHRADVRETEAWWNGELFDHILCDVPCSGTGVIRRHPDIKILRQADDIKNLSEEQATYLKALWPLLKKGGTLLYVTCSVLPQENQQVIENFLESEPTVREISLKIKIGNVETNIGQQILPTQTETFSTDGFYYALLKKSKNAF